ncbi:MAG: hypothetical protein JO144_11675, partial [Actinobacteria bacterium]|nr:hypothetical protein [Actinomycetota bacterium]
MGIPHRTRSLQAAALVVLASAGLIAGAPAASASTLTASLTCETYPLGFDCDGFASGGTGGYTFTWSRPTASRTDTATSSSAVFA